MLRLRREGNARHLMLIDDSTRRHFLTGPGLYGFGLSNICTHRLQCGRLPFEMCSVMFSREFNHRVKGISMSSFKPEEVEALEKGGNKVFFFLVYFVLRIKNFVDCCWHLACALGRAGHPPTKIQRQGKFCNCHLTSLASYGIALSGQDQVFHKKHV